VQIKPQVLSKGAKMATVKIDLSLEDTRGSIKRRKTDVENLNRELEKTKQLSTRWAVEKAPSMVVLAEAWVLPEPVVVTLQTKHKVLVD
jgi:hypothetical protein